MSIQSAYELFVGQITPQEFLYGFDSIQSAVSQLIAESWWKGDDYGTPAPDNLADLISRYVEKELAAMAL
jgi:hypothetical protein